MTEPLAAKRILITGAGRGLGLAIATACAEAGAELVVTDIDGDRLQGAAAHLNALGGEVSCHELDVSDPVSVDAVFDAIDRPLWAVVNNAALADSVGGKPFWDLTPTEWDELMAVNVRGVWLVSRAAAEGFRRERAGRIVNLASDAAIYGSPRLAHYVASKGAVMALTRSMARDLGEFEVTVNAIAPGIVETESTRGVPPERHALYADNRAISRPQQPDDVVGAVVFLLSEDAAYLTGQTLVVDGGFVMS